MLMQEKERVTEGKTGILDGDAGSDRYEKRRRERHENDGEAKEQR